MAVIGAGLLFCGIYCIRMTGESEHGLLCLLIGAITLLSGLALPIVASVGAFNDKEVKQAIICIVVYAISLVLGVIFAKKLWY
jgi:hypothetical protein